LIGFAEKIVFKFLICWAKAVDLLWIEKEELGLSTLKGW